MTDKTQLDIDHVLRLKAELRRINSLDLAELEFMHSGAPVTVDREAIDEWRFTGLNNTDFLEFLDLETGKLREPEIPT
jgi:hypothetical protein